MTRQRMAWLVAAGALLVSACGGGSGPSRSPAETSTPSPTPTATPSPTPEPTPTPSPVPWPSIKALPAGVTRIDVANILGRVELSPDGRLLAVAAGSGRLGIGEIHVLDPDLDPAAAHPGEPAAARIATYFGTDFAWIDSTHLIALETTDDGSGTGRAVIHEIGPEDETALPGAYAGLLGNGHGLVALWPGESSFLIWSEGALGPAISGHGRPGAWSADGTLLALAVPVASAAPSPSEPRCVGCVRHVPATLELMSFPGSTTAVAAAEPQIDAAAPLLFSRDGRYVAAEHAVFDTSTGAAVDLPAGLAAATAAGWTPDGRLILEAAGKTSLWTVGGAVQKGPAGNTVVYGATIDAVAIGLWPSAGKAGSATVQLAGHKVSLAAHAPGIYWAPGGVCYVSIGTDTARLPHDFLYRIDLRP